MVRHVRVWSGLPFLFPLTTGMWKILVTILLDNHRPQVNDMIHANEDDGQIGLKFMGNAVLAQLIEAKKNNNGKMPYGMIQRTVQENKDKFPGLTNIYIKNLLQSHGMKQKDASPERSSHIEVPETQHPPVPAPAPVETRNYGGRPKGTTRAEQNEKKVRGQNMVNAIALEYSSSKYEYENDTLPRGLLDTIIEEKKDEYLLPNYAVSKNTIMRRHKKKQYDVMASGGRDSPAKKLDDPLVAVFHNLADMNKPLSPGEAIKMANDLLIGTDLEKAIILYKNKIGTPCDANGRNLSDGQLLGAGWWRRFLRRNKHRLVSKRGRKFSLNRTEWCTFANFAKMYDLIYEEMVGAGVGVAVKLDVPILVDVHGNEVEDEAKAYGRKCTHKILLPENCYVFDETGGNINMKMDGHYGGTTYLTQPGCTPMLRASENESHFSTLTVTSLSGEPALCVIIFKGE